MHSVVIAAAGTVRTMPVQVQPTSASASISCTIAVREHSATGLLALPPKVECDGNVPGPPPHLARCAAAVDPETKQICICWKTWRTLLHRAFPRELSSTSCRCTLCMGFRQSCSITNWVVLEHSTQDRVNLGQHNTRSCAELASHPREHHLPEGLHQPKRHQVRRRQQEEGPEVDVVQRRKGGQPAMLASTSSSSTSSARTSQSLRQMQM